MKELAAQSQRRLRQQGQTLVEYVLLIVLIIGFVGILARNMQRAVTLISSRVTGKFAMAYQLGDKDAKDISSGEFKKHPRANVSGGNNFRIFRRAQ